VWSESKPRCTSCLPSHSIITYITSTSHINPIHITPNVTVHKKHIAPHPQQHETHPNYTPTTPYLNLPPPPFPSGEDHDHHHHHHHSHSHGQHTPHGNKPPVERELQVVISDEGKKTDGGCIERAGSGVSNTSGNGKQGPRSEAGAWGIFGLNRVSIGLIIHAAMDGIPLGAAAVSGNSSVEALLLLAIILHKAPASFGLSSFLIGSGLPRKIVLRNLLAFCLAAPLMMIMVVVLVRSLGASPDVASSSDITGLGLLFSAGTMMHTVSTHVLPAVHQPSEDKTVMLLETTSFVLGLMVPFAIDIAHGVNL